MPIGYFSFETWEEAHRSFSNNKLRVILESKDNPGRYAYFKYGYELGVDTDFHGPLAANERISYEIAEYLEMPVMPVQFYRHLGLRGHLRWAVPSTCRNWSYVDFPIKKDIPRYFNHPEVLIQMFVFDVFVCNHDRHEGNVMYTTSPRKGKHDIYLIDHDLALYGTERKWRRYAYNDNHWFDAARFLRLNEVSKMINTYGDLKPYVEQVQSMSDAHLDQIISGVNEVDDGGYLDDQEALLIRNMLHLRKGRLHTIFHDWCRENGKS